MPKLAAERIKDILRQIDAIDGARLVRFDCDFTRHTLCISLFASAKMQPHAH